MSSGMHFENYLESLSSLPSELQSNFNNMRELDQKVQEMMRNIDKMSDDYLHSIKTMSQEKRNEQISKIQSLFSKSKAFSDDKVQLAIQTYELVDKHIRKLDSDLAKFEAETKEKALGNASKKEEENVKKKGRKKKEVKTKSKKRGQQSDEEELPQKGRKKQKKKPLEPESAIASVLPGLSVTHPADVLDMPVDPNEPTYCTCQQVSYGEMIACDKPDCSIEWFHFACVGLTTKPKGKWYCTNCSNERKKK